MRTTSLTLLLVLAVGAANGDLEKEALACRTSHATAIENVERLMAFDDASVVHDGAAQVNLQGEADEPSDQPTVFSARSSRTARQPAQRPRAASAPPQKAPKPSAPDLLTAVANGPTQVVLGWKRASNASQIKVLASANGATFRILQTLPAQATATTLGGLAPNTSFVFVIEAVGSGGVTRGNSRTVRTPPAAPSRPDLQSAVATAPTKVALRWAASANATGYRALASANNATFRVVATLPVTVTAHELTGLAADTTFTFLIEATGPGGTTRGNSKMVKTPKLGPPIPPPVTRINYTLYRQTDALWGNDLMGNSGLRVKSFGCMMTSLAMGTNLSPKTLNQMLSARGGYTASGALIHSVAAAVTGTSYVGAGQLGNAQSVKTALLRGELMIAKSTRFSEHWVLVISSDGTVVQYADPADATVRNVGDGWVSAGAATRVYRR